jgi:hypothetical protein
MILGRAVAVAAAAVLLLVPAVADADPYRVAVLRALDKVTARTSMIDAPVDQPVRFGNLEITARWCDKRPPEETPESAAFLEIDEIKHDGDRRSMFVGWMFASSPGLSALEHPIYDVWVLDCTAPLMTDSPSSPPR